MRTRLPALLCALAVASTAAASTIQTSQLSQNGWYSDDTRADGTGSEAAGTNLISPTRTDDPEGSASGTIAHDADILNQISFAEDTSVPGGTFPGHVRMTIGPSGSGKSQISHRNPAGFATGTAISDPGFFVDYSWRGDGTPTVTASFKIGFKTSEFGSAGVSSRTGENDWDKVLIYEPGQGNGQNSDGSWYTESISRTSGNWWFFDRVAGAGTIGTPMTLDDMDGNATIFSGAKTIGDVYDLITDPGALITSVQFGIGSGNAGGDVRVNQLETSFYRPGDITAFGQTSSIGDAFPTKFAGDFISGSGIPADNFLSDSNGDVSVFIKPRGRDSGQPLLISGNTFLLLSGAAVSNPGASWWSFDFQFSPSDADTIGGTNYNLLLEFDTDPTSGEALALVGGPIWDADALDYNSWDDGDSFFANPGPGSWSNDDTDYVISQSWRADFGFLNGSILPPGDYTIRFTATDENGNKLASVEAIARVVDAGDASLSLDAQDTCLNADDTQVVVDVNMANPPGSIVGGQFFLDYDNTVLDFISIEPGDAPFTDELYEFVDEGAGTIDYSVNAPLGDPGTSSATTMARITFNLADDACFEDALVSWRVNAPPTRITMSGGADIQPAEANLTAVTIDSEAPMLTVNDLEINADAGVCTGVLTTGEPFNLPVVTGPSQAPDTWYTDRYNPAIFESDTFMGENVLHHGVDVADSAANRPPSFSSLFYNTQGRKYDIDLPTGSTLSADVWIPSSYETDARNVGLWGTTMDSGGNITGFPIISYGSNDPADPLNPDPVNPAPRFRIYVQDSDFNASNGYQPDYVDLYALAPADFDKWYRFEITLTQIGYVFTVTNITDDVEIFSVLDPNIFGSIRIANVILQMYNFGETYDGYWDNVTLNGEGPIVTDDCSAPTLSFERSDNPALGLNDPYPTGDTTVTWTATDLCGNTATIDQIITVNGVNNLDVAVELIGVTASFDRCVTFELTPTGGGVPVVVEETLSFTSGIANATIEVPCGDYECIDARDTLHTLRARDDDDFAIDGTMYVADFTASGDGDALTGGNFNDDEFIDILDFGVFVSQYNTAQAANTPCGFVGPNADADGDGFVGSVDFSFIQTQFLFAAELPCGGAPAQWDGNPVEFISVTELEAMGMHDLVVADLNADGWVDEFDIAAFASGVEPDRCDEDLSGDGLVNVVDLNVLLSAFGVSDLGDINKDGVTDGADLNLLLARFADACN